MNTLEAIKTRRSIRKYTQQPLEFDKITKIVEAGHFAPSSGNIQNWRFIVITDKETIRGLYHHCLKQEHVYNAQSIIVICGDTETGERFYGLRGKRLYTTQNCAAAIQNMLLAAHELGIGACWIGAFDEDKIRVMFNIPEKARPQAMITLGYPDVQPGPPERDELASVTFFHKYGSKIKDLHLVLRDYSVEWEKQMQAAEETTDKLFEKIRKHAKKLHAHVKNKLKKKK